MSAAVPDAGDSASEATDRSTASVAWWRIYEIGTSGYEYGHKANIMVIIKNTSSIIYIHERRMCQRRVWPIVVQPGRHRSPNHHSYLSPLPHSNSTTLTMGRGAVRLSLALSMSVRISHHDSLLFRIGSPRSLAQWGGVFMCLCVLVPDVLLISCLHCSIGHLHSPIDSIADYLEDSWLYRDDPLKLLIRFSDLWGDEGYSCCASYPSPPWWCCYCSTFFYMYYNIGE